MQADHGACKRRIFGWRPAALFSLALLCPTLGAAAEPAAQLWEAEVKKLAQPVVDAGLVPGMAIGIYEDGRVETYGLGVIAEDRPVPPDASTVYEIGSVSKVFTALLLAIAVGRGEVALSDPLSRLLPANVEAPKRGGKEITLEHLATHFSGLPRLPSNLPVDSLDDPYAGYTREKLFAYLNGLRLRRSPGTRYEYSNLGFGLLGTLLSDQAKMDYDALVRERIAKPLAMADTGVRLSEDQVRRLAVPHRSGFRVSSWDGENALAGCGALRSTVRDLLRLVAAQVDPASSPLKDALTLVARRRREVGQNNSGIAGIALGWGIGERSTLLHNGQTGGYSSMVLVNPTHKKGVVVLANGGADSVIDLVAEGILRTMVGESVEPPHIRPSITLSDSQLDRLVGEYPSPYDYSLSITRQGHALLARLTGQPALRVYPETPTRFFYREVEAELEFEIDATTGRASAVTLFQNGQKARFKRKP